MKIPDEVKKLAEKVEPLNGRVVIWPCDVQFSDRDSLLFRPDTAEDAPETGIIVGADSDFLVEGDVVLFGRYSGYGIADNILLVCREEDVFMRLHGVKVATRQRTEHPLRVQGTSGLVT